MRLTPAHHQQKNKQTKLYVNDSISFSKKLKFWEINWPTDQRAQVRGRGRSKKNRTKNRGMNENISEKNIQIRTTPIQTKA